MLFMGFCSIILALYLFYVRDSNLGRFRPMMPRCLKSCLPFWKDTSPGFKILVWQSLSFSLVFQLMQFQSLVNILRGKLAEYWAQFPLFLSTQCSAGFSPLSRGPQFMFSLISPPVYLMPRISKHSEEKNGCRVSLPLFSKVLAASSCSSAFKQTF